jgi:hypothetical protein
VELRAATPLRADQSGRLENAEMLRDGLAGRPDAVAHREQTADLEQRLPVAHGEFIQNQTPGLVVKSPEHVRHMATIRKSLLTYQALIWIATGRPDPAGEIG